MQLRSASQEDEPETYISAKCSGLVGALQMAQAGLAAEDEQVAVDACEIFIDLIEAPAPVLGPSIPDLVRWCMQVATSTQYELATREMALQARVLSHPPNVYSMSWLRLEYSGSRADSCDVSKASDVHSCSQLNVVHHAYMAVPNQAMHEILVCPARRYFMEG